MDPWSDLAALLTLLPWAVLYALFRCLGAEAVVAQKSVCVVNAIGCSALGIYGLLLQENLRADVIDGHWPLLHDVFAPLSFGYFVFDTLMMVFRPDQPGVEDGTASILHHIVLIVTIATYYRVNRGDFIVVSFAAWELSTPFVHARWYLSHRGMRASPLYLWNGVALTTAFFLARICNLPFVMYLFAQQRGLPLWQAIASIPLVCRTVTAGIFFLNLYWFGKILQGAAKLLVVRRHKKAS